LSNDYSHQLKFKRGDKVRLTTELLDSMQDRYRLRASKRTCIILGYYRNGNSYRPMCRVLPDDAKNGTPIYYCEMYLEKL
jgi:hypothetical protein